MQRHRTEATGIEPHVFDQTNGLVDLGAGEPDPHDGRAGRLRDRAVAGIAMLSTQRP